MERDQQNHHDVVPEKTKVQIKQNMLVLKRSKTDHNSAVERKMEKNRKRKKLKKLKQKVKEPLHLPWDQ